METPYFVLLTVLFVILIIFFLVIFLFWKSSDDTKNNGPGTSCSSTSDCAYGLICKNGDCVNLEFTSCDPDNDTCPEGFSCVNGICTPIFDECDRIFPKRRK